MSAARANSAAFQPMKATASRETPVGFELEPFTKKRTLLKTRMYLNAEQLRVKDIHTDYEAARRAGFRRPVVPGRQNTELIGEMLVKFFGEGYLGGNLSIAFIKVVEVGDELTTKGVVREKVVEGNAIRLILDVWCENQRGEKVVVGTASGLVC